MAKTLYYFRPTELAHVLRKVPRSCKIVPIDRNSSEGLAWQFPAILLADSTKEDIRRFHRLAPEDGRWRVVAFLKGSAAPRSRSKLANSVFAALPLDVPRFVLESTIEKAFENLRS